MSSLRPPTLEDVPHAARLANEHSRDPVDEERLRQEWTSPKVDLEQDARVDERTYAIVEDLGEGRVWIELHGDPSPAALEWAETRAHQLGGRRLFTGGWSTNTALFEVIEARGYALTRHSATLEIELTDDLPEPVWPAGITARVMREGEERTFYEVHQEAFRDTWEHTEDPFEEWSHWLLRPPRFDPGLWFLATAVEDACGIAICEPRPTLPDLGWVRILAVRREWRRRGVGRALLLHSLHALRERGFARAGLGVDSTSPTGAHTLYESVGMRATQRFDIYERTVA